MKIPEIKRLISYVEILDAVELHGETAMRIWKMDCKRLSSHLWDHASDHYVYFICALAEADAQKHGVLVENAKEYIEKNQGQDNDRMLDILYDKHNLCSEIVFGVLEEREKTGQSWDVIPVARILMNSHRCKRVHLWRIVRMIKPADSYFLNIPCHELLSKADRKDMYLHLIDKLPSGYMKEDYKRYVQMSDGTYWKLHGFEK